MLEGYHESGRPSLPSLQHLVDRAIWRCYATPALSGHRSRSAEVVR
jgi:hypothetical protein